MLIGTVCAQLSATPQNGEAPLSVQFSTSFPDAVVWAWDFGDGKVQGGTPNPLHVYTNPGDFDALVSWANRQGKGGAADMIINVRPVPIVGNTNPYCGPGNVVTYPDGKMDGPASLPGKCFYTKMSATPTPNTPKLVKATDDLQTSLNTAVCGDMFLVDPQNSYTGNLKLPNCADGWIVIGAADIVLLPDEDTRISPAYAGIVSLPGRPPYRQPVGGAQRLMPQILLKAGQQITGGIGVRLIGFEIGRTGPGTVNNMFAPGKGNRLILDRDWIHGTAIDETVRGVFLADTVMFAAINSYFSDFHCLAQVGSCTDAQAIVGGVGNTNSAGTYKIVNNYLESSGENILFGGGASFGPPEDITVMYNDFFKPMLWNPQDPSYVPIRSHSWIVKNHFECKNCLRVLLEGNRLQNVWGGFSQVGSSILLTPKPQGTLCPKCSVNDITLRYNYVSYADQAQQFSYGSSDDGSWAQESARWSTHDIVFDHLQYKTCSGCGAVMNQLGSGLSPAGFVLHDVKEDHLTIINDGWMQTKPPLQWPSQIMLGMSAPPLTATKQMYNINVTNSIMPTGAGGMYSLGGGTTNCVSGALTPVDKVNCWKGTSSFIGNVIMNAGYGGKLPWPAGNFTIGSWTGVGFTDQAAGNYKLSDSSPYLKKGTDGKDIGADIDLVNAAIGKRQ